MIIKLINTIIYFVMIGYVLYFNHTNKILSSHHDLKVYIGLDICLLAIDFWIGGILSVLNSIAIFWACTKDVHASHKLLVKRQIKINDKKMVNFINKNANKIQQIAKNPKFQGFMNDKKDNSKNKQK